MNNVYLSTHKYLIGNYLPGSAWSLGVDNYFVHLGLKIVVHMTLLVQVAHSFESLGSSLFTFSCDQISCKYLVFVLIVFFKANFMILSPSHTKQML